MTSFSSPSVSVVIPAYNSEPFISQAVDSVFAQKAVPSQVIVIDDGSSDGTADLIHERYGADVQLIRQSNAGPAAARNRGIAEADGDFVAFLDADDLWTPEKISRQLEFFEAHPDCGLVCADMVDFGPGGEECQSHFAKRGLGENFFGGEELVEEPFAKILAKNFVSTPSVLVRRQLLLDAGGFPEQFRYAEDYLLWLRLATISTVGYQPQIFVKRRRHESNLTNDVDYHVRNRIRVLNYIEASFGDELDRSGVSLRDRFAGAWFQLGYHNLYQKSGGDVVRPFWNSFRHSPTPRTAFYLLITAMGLRGVCVQLRKRLRNMA